MAYHFDISKQPANNVFNNAIEILLLIRNPIETKSVNTRNSRVRKKRKIKRRKPKNKTSIRKDIDNIKPQEKIIEAPLDSIVHPQQVLADSSKVSPLQTPNLEESNSDSLRTENWKTSLMLGNENRLQFEYNSTTINETSYQKLREIATLLKKYKNAQIILIGHTDNIGSTLRNKNFSIKRAKAGARVLKGLGIPASQIIIQGKGESEPIDTNATEEGRSQNRRIEYYIINNN